jgi:hypothetical protein
MGRLTVNKKDNLFESFLIRNAVFFFGPRKKLLFPLQFLFVFLFNVLAVNFCQSQTVLTQNDVAIIGFNASGTDQFSVVLLRDIEPNTTISFTDNGMNSPTLGRTGEGFLSYSSILGDCAGTVLTWTAGMSVAGTGWNAGAPSNFAFNASGDQLFVFQGLSTDWATQNNITIIYAINTNVNWLTTGTAASTSSYFPDQLLLGGSFLNTLPNFCYINSTISDSRANILTSIVDPANINSSNSQIIFPMYTNFVVNDGLVSTVNSDNQSICLGQSISTISYQIAGQSVNVTGLPTGVNAAFVNGVLSITGMPSAFGTFGYTVAITGCNTLSQNGTITVNDLSAPTAVSPQAFCSSTASIADLIASGTNIQWFDVPSGGTALPANTILTNGNYYAQSILGACQSTLTAVAVSIGSTVAAPTAVSPQPFCSSTASIADLIASGTNIQWFDVPSGGTALPANTILTNGNYYAQSISGVCQSTLTTVAVSIGSSVAAPTAVSPQIFCNSTSTISNLNATGTNILWYTSSTGGSALAANAFLAAGNYYAADVVNGCESTVRTIVVVGFNPTAAPQATAQSFCSSAQPIIQDLVAVGSSIQWYNSSAGGSPLPLSQILNSGIYYASATTGGCESVTRTATNVLVELASSPAVLSGNSAICLGQNGQLFASEPAGFWSSSSPNIAVNALTGLISTFSVGNSLVSYTLTGNGVCPAVVSDYAVAVIDIPSVFLGNDTTICSNDFPFVLFAANAQLGLNFTWNDSQTTQGINVSNAGIYSVTVENPAGCVNTDEIQIQTQAQPQTTILGSAIDFYIYNGQTYTQDGIYTQNISNPAGCDSLITLILTFDYLGLENTENDFLKLYPNPALSNLFVENSRLAGVEIVVSNTEGKILKQIYAENGTTVIDLSVLESGVYFLSYSTIDRTLSKKFIKL